MLYCLCLGGLTACYWWSGQKRRGSPLSLMGPHTPLCSYKPSSKDRECTGNLQAKCRVRACVRAGHTLPPEPHPSLMGSSEGQCPSPWVDSALYLPSGVCMPVSSGNLVSFPGVFVSFCQLDRQASIFSMDQYSSSQFLKIMLN